MQALRYSDSANFSNALQVAVDMSPSVKDSRPQARNVEVLPKCSVFPRPLKRFFSLHEGIL